MPIARSSHSIAPLGERGNNLVVFGGEHAPRVPVGNSTYVYDMGSSVWKRIEACSESPSDRLAHAAASISSSLMLLHGGRSQVEESSALDDLYSFDINSAVWSRLKPKGPVPEPRNFHSAATTSDGTFYIFGGCGVNGRLADLWRYDIRENSWEALPGYDSMLGRGGAGFVEHGQELWVIGGFTGKESNEVFRFDLRNNTWETVHTTQPEDSNLKFTARSVFGKSCHSAGKSGAQQCCSHADHIIVFGGEIDPSDLGHAGAGQFDDTCFCLNTSTRSWHVLDIKNNKDAGKAPGPRGWAASCAVPEGLVVHGGIDISNTRLGDMYMLDIHA